MTKQHQFQTTGIRFISDNSHGWLEVPTEDVKASGYVPSKYSYQVPKQWRPGIQATAEYMSDTNRLYTYLEEDSDATGYLATLAVTGIDVEQIDKQIGGHNWIRDLPHCDGVGYVSPFGGK